MEIRHGLAYVNGKKLELPPTVSSTIETDTIHTVSYPPNSDWNTHNYGPLVVPKNDNNPYYFVLGDNRPNSLDGLAWVFVCRENII